MPKLRGLRWWIIGLVCLGTVVNYIARSSLSVAAPTLLKELHMTTQDYSYVLAAFQAGYTIAQPICGYVLDVIGLKLGFAIFATIWALVNVAHALATSRTGLAILRGLMGLSEATVAGLAGTAAWLGTLIFSLLMGALVASIGYNPFFIALALFDWVGAAILWTLVHRKEDTLPGLAVPSAAE